MKLTRLEGIGISIHILFLFLYEIYIELSQIYTIRSEDN
jgi:hypothetical protein